MFAGELQKQKALFAAADGLAVLSAFVAALRIHDPSAAIEERLLRSGPALDGLGVALIVLVWLLVFQSNDLYRMRNGGYKELVTIIYASSVATILTLLGVFLAHVQLPRITVAIGYVLAVPFIVTARATLRFCIGRIYANPKIAIPLVIVGFNPVGEYLCDQIFDEIGPYEPVGFIDEGPDGRQYRGLPVFAPLALLKEFAAMYPSIEVAIALPDAARDKIERITGLCDETGLDWWIVPWMLRSLASGLKVEWLGVVPLIGRRSSNIEGLNLALKRTFDAVFGAILLFVAAPIVAFAALAILLDDGRPIFFRQTRIGAHGRSFEMIKLRTMRHEAGDETHRACVRHWIRPPDEAPHLYAADGNRVFKLLDDHRVTRIGRILRRFSVDELPQLINVVRGQMSLIGPRPALPYEIGLYENWQRRRLDAMPGITGLWQVSGRNRLSFDEMVRLDVQYLEEWSLVGDLKILARTVPVLLRGNGI